MKIRNFLTILAGLITGTAGVCAQQSFTLDEIAPSLTQLGSGWTSNHVVVSLDQRNPNREICNEGKGFLEAAHRVVGRKGCEAYCVLRYTYGASQCLVWIHRYKSPESIEADWGTDPATKATMQDLPKLGDEVRFYQRHGIHNNVAFRKGSYLIDVEAPNTWGEELKKLAAALDANLTKAQSSPAARPK